MVAKEATGHLESFFLLSDLLNDVICVYFARCVSMLDGGDLGPISDHGTLGCSDGRESFRQGISRAGSLLALGFLIGFHVSLLLVCL